MAGNGCGDQKLCGVRDDAEGEGGSGVVALSHGPSVLDQTLEAFRGRTEDGKRLGKRSC